MVTERSENSCRHYSVQPVSQRAERTDIRGLASSNRAGRRRRKGPKPRTGRSAPGPHRGDPLWRRGLRIRAPASEEEKAIYASTLAAICQFWDQPATDR